MINKINSEIEQMSCPPLNWIHSKAFQQQFKELTNFVKAQTHTFVVARSEVPPQSNFDCPL
jgi:hypothetical protein